MAISFPLVAKGLAGLAAIGAPVTLSVVYKDSISNLLSRADASNVANPTEKPNHEKINEKLKTLGIPENKCQFLESETSKECDLSKNDLDKLEFVTSDSSSSSTGNDGESNQIKLKIEKVTEEEKSIFGDLKFSFPDITKTIKIGSTGNQIILKKGSKPEFKINSSGDKLEKAWDIDKLSEKVGLKCKQDNEKKCILDTNKSINIKDGTKVATSVKFTGESLTFTEDQEDHNQGFKFTVNGNSDISLSEGTNSNSIQITKDNATYQIIKEDNTWYLSKLTTTTNQ